VSIINIFDFIICAIHVNLQEIGNLLLYFLQIKVFTKLQGDLILTSANLSKIFSD
jgi:hypothetical protein